MSYLPRGNDSNSGLSAKSKNSNTSSRWHLAFSELLAWQTQFLFPILENYGFFFAGRSSNLKREAQDTPTVHRCSGQCWGEEPSLCCCSGEPGAWEDFCWKNMASWEGRQTKPVGSGFIIEQQSPVKGATDPCFVQWSRERVQMQPGGRACFLSKCTLALLSQLTVLRAIQGPEPFQVNFLIYCHLPIPALPPHPKVPFTLRYLLLLLLPIVKRKKKQEKHITPPCRHVIPYVISSTEVVSHFAPTPLAASCACRASAGSPFQNNCDS